LALFVVTHCDELQVNKADRNEVEVVPHCDELQVNKADRTEVEVVTHCDELQVNKKFLKILEICFHNIVYQISYQIHYIHIYIYTEKKISVRCQYLDMSSMEEMPLVLLAIVLSVLLRFVDSD
jgi:hypothetical protein